MRKVRKKGSEAKGANWMDTYGDMVTLLLTFFVLLYSFSSVDNQKWERLVAAMTGNKGVLMDTSTQNVMQFPQLEDNKSDFDSEGNPIDQTALDDYQSAMENADNLYAKIKGYVDKNNLSEDIMMSRAGSEIRIRFTNNVLFDSGKAVIREEAYGILNEIANAIIAYPQTIEMIKVEGHTDNVPIFNRDYPSNWELSTDRAVRVVRYLIENKQIPSNIISAAGYGEHHPFGDNNTEDGRKLNRRVDFVINVAGI